MTQRRVSFAQHGEDIVLERALRGVKDITYVDVGAADPTVDSISRSLHGFGWRGIHLEPMPAYAERLRLERKGDIVIQVAIGESPGTAPFWFVSGSGLSTMDAREAERAQARGWAVNQGAVEVRTLDDVLDQHISLETEIHALKIDVEGAEASVLRSIDLGRRRPWIVLVEATRPDSTESTAHLWEDLLLDSGYVLTMFDGLNRWYVAREHSDLADKLSYPACPLDPWLRVTVGFPDPPSGEPAEVLAGALLEIKAAQAVASAAELRKRDLQAQLERARVQLSEEQSRTEHVKRQLEDLRQSPWWRATSPGRRVGARLKRLSRRIRRSHQRSD